MWGENHFALRPYYLTSHLRYPGDRSQEWECLTSTFCTPACETCSSTSSRAINSAHTCDSRYMHGLQPISIAYSPLDCSQSCAISNAPLLDSRPASCRANFQLPARVDTDTTAYILSAGPGESRSSHPAARRRRDPRASQRGGGGSCDAAEARPTNPVARGGGMRASAESVSPRGGKSSERRRFAAAGVRAALSLLAAAAGASA